MLPRRVQKEESLCFLIRWFSRKFYCNENGLYTDSLIDTHGDYLLSPKRIAEEKGVVFIDMNKITHDLVKQMGPEKSKELFMWVGKRKDDSLI